MHPRAPWTDVTFTGVFWNDPGRVRALLESVRPWFTNIVVGVQTSEPDTDPTLAACREIADKVVVDAVHGVCEPTINKVLGQIRTPWSFLVSADERPSEALLNDIQDMVTLAAEGNGYTPTDGYWLRFVSSIEGVEYPSEQDNHLRMFLTRLGWPPTMHSRPPTTQAVFWRPSSYIRHDRSLDEMMTDYLRYLSMSGSNTGWVEHNKMMMREACLATARHYGWDHVTAFPWWEAILVKAFDGRDPRGGTADG